MAFLAPAFLAGALAAAVPIVLHLLKREPEPRIKFAAVRLLRNAPVELSEKRRLRELLLLALRVTAFVLLALAFARPFWPTGLAAGSAGVTVVAVDTSYSLSAPGRFDKARSLAAQAVDRAPAGDLVAVLAFSDAVDTLAKPTSDRALARSAVDALTPGAGATKYRAALDTAAQLLAGRRGTIVVVTDLQENGWDAGDHASVPESARIEVVDVGAPPDDLAVTGLRQTPGHLVATVRNTASRAREARLRLTLDGREAGAAQLMVGAGSSAEAVFPAASSAREAAVDVDDPDGLQADNVRYALLDGGGRPTLVIVTGSGDAGHDAFYVQQALAAESGRGEGYDISSVSGAQLSASADKRLASAAAVILLSTRGLERHGREALAAYTQRGGGMLIAAGPEIDGEVVADVLGGATTLRIAADPNDKPVERAFAPADGRHPVFQPFSSGASALGLAKFTRVARVSGAGCQTVARFTSGEPAVLDCQAGEGRALVLASDLDTKWNDFPLHASFVPFLHETVRYVSSASRHAGDYLVADVPSGLPPRPGFENWPAEAKKPGDRARRVAVNVDPLEADGGRISADEFQAAVMRLKDVGASQARVEAQQQEERQHLWAYGLVLMMLTLAVEGVVASRTA